MRPILNLPYPSDTGEFSFKRTSGTWGGSTTDPPSCNRSVTQVSVGGS